MRYNADTIVALGSWALLEQRNAELQIGAELVPANAAHLDVSPQAFPLGGSMPPHVRQYLRERGLDPHDPQAARLQIGPPRRRPRRAPPHPWRRAPPSRPRLVHSAAVTRLVASAVLVLGLGCAGGTKPEPDRGRLRQPTGVALDPGGNALFVSNGNWDIAEAAGTLMVIDIGALHQALLGDVGGMGASLSASRPCRRVDGGDATIECDEAMFIDSSATVLLGSAVGNIAIDRPTGDEGRSRLLVPQRVPAAVVWMDTVLGGEGIVLECGQADDGRCDEDHRITVDPDNAGVALPNDPSRVVVDDQGYRFAYVPQLLGGSLSLIDLDGELGPELTNRFDEFYAEDAFELGTRGGFSVASMACDPDNPVAESRDCTRPFLYSTNRFFPGLHEFVVAPGLQVLVQGASADVSPVGTEAMEPRPILGDLAFEEPDVGDRLLVVQTTPGALARVDTGIDPDNERPRNELQGTVALCSNPNLLRVFRPPGEEALALVSCFSDGLLAAVGLGTFTVLGSVEVGAGANEVAIDEDRRQAYVANTRENTISIVSLDRRDPRFLTEWARIGLGGGSR